MNRLTGEELDRVCSGGQSILVRRAGAELRLLRTVEEIDRACSDGKSTLVRRPGAELRSLRTEPKPLSDKELDGLCEIGVFPSSVYERADAEIRELQKKVAHLARQLVEVEYNRANEKVAIQRILDQEKTETDLASTTNPA